MLKAYRTHKRQFIYGSKEGQDQLVEHLLDGAGYFLDVGCGPPEHTNNTVRPEGRGWRGLLIDNDPYFVAHCRRKRKNRTVRVDCAIATRSDWLNLLAEHDVPRVVDYISLDANDANTQFMREFPFDEYRFKIMTFETDHYKCGGTRKDAAIRRLSASPQYRMILEDAMLEPGGRIWEDWWVNEDYIRRRESYAKSMHWGAFLDRLRSVR